ncbi:MAG: hypothetical protein OK422_06045 [Thaumarchaeota archaeon]|nr:hypothetical protein [Nitrososphaerota archaeon]
MPRLNASKRAKLESSQYACPTDRKLPINDAAHVRKAMITFSRVNSNICHPRLAKQRILEAAKKFGIDVTEFKEVKRHEKIDTFLEKIREDRYLSI